MGFVDSFVFSVITGCLFVMFVCFLLVWFDCGFVGCLVFIVSVWYVYITDVGWWGGCVVVYLAGGDLLYLWVGCGGLIDILSFNLWLLRGFVVWLGWVGCLDVGLSLVAIV